MYIPVFHEFSLVLDNSVIFFMFVLFLVLLTEKRPRKITKITCAIVLAALLVYGLKGILQVPRPCVGEDFCPLSFSFPSGHAAIALTLMLAFINKKSFPLFWVFAFFIGMSRLYLGVHYFEDIAAGFIIAPVSYLTVDTVWRWYHERKK